MTLQEKAERLRALHHGEAPLLLPNAWDVASARVLEEAGFPAIATTSAGIANSLGYPDGQRIPRSEMLAAVARIAGAVRVPVTADFEAGYTADAAGVGEAVGELVAVGAVGLNLEDLDAQGTRLAPLELQLEKIAAVRAAGAAAGVPLVLNARTDALFLPSPPEFDPLEEAIRRARAYRAAGADCIFVPGLRDLKTIARLLAASPGPLNILGGLGAPDVADLQHAGVRRISLGSGPYRAALGLLRRIGAELRQRGSYGLMAEHAIPYAEVNGWVGGVN